MTKSTDERPARLKEPGDFIPNSYQTPNDYADLYMHLLSGDEWKVLSYAVRRTFGFGRYDRPEDRISVSQFQQGKRSRETGQMLDHGTGLSRPTIIKALAALCDFGLIVFVAPNDLRANDGDAYGLQLDPSKVQLDQLLARVEQKRETARSRTSAARKLTPRHRANTHTQSPVTYQTPSKCDLPPPVNATYQPESPEPVSGTDAPRYVPLTAGGKSHLNTIPRGKPGENQNTHTPRTSEPPGPPKPVCVCRTAHASEFCEPARREYALAHPVSINVPDRWVWSKRACDGEFDAGIRRWLTSGKPVEGTAATAKPADTSACPDCRGSGSVFDDPADPKTHRRCKHPRLFPRAEAAAAPP